MSEQDDEEDNPTVAYDGPLVGPAAPGPSAQPEQPTVSSSPVAAAVPAPVPPVATPPADTDPAALQVASGPSFRDRGRLRRRLRYLRRVRELGFRDLGGLVFDLYRFDRDGRDLTQAKLDALAVVDRELRALERVLKDKPQFVDLREPGIAACPRCAALHGTDARFCPNCGLQLDRPQPASLLAEAGGLGSPPR